jgi:hypothetical protein
MSSATVAADIIGIVIVTDHACPKCKSARRIIGPGKAMHAGSLRCCDCDRHNGWLDRITADFLIELVTNFGRPTEPVRIRHDQHHDGELRAAIPDPSSAQDKETSMPISTAQQLKLQEEQAARGQAPSTAVVPAKPALPAAPGAVTNVAAYLDEVAPSGIVGRMIKWSKDGKFIYADSEEAIGEEQDFIVLADQTVVGWIKFIPDGPPERIMGLLYDGFAMPPRDELDEQDPSEWEVGLDGQPADPWVHQMMLVLQHADTGELATFVTSSKTGRRAVGNLLRHYNQMLRLTPDQLPVIKLKKGGFAHRDERIGWVAVPAFAVVARAPRDSAARPDTSTEADLDDSIPF